MAEKSLTMMAKMTDPNSIDYYTLLIVPYHQKSESNIITRIILAAMAKL